jgi:hypothetical protein
MKLLYHMRLLASNDLPSTDRASGTNSAIYLPFDVNGHTSIRMKDVHVSNTGTGNTSVEQLRIRFFSQQAGALASSERHHDFVVPVMGRSDLHLMNCDYDFFQHLSSSQNISPSVKAYTFAGAQTITSDIYVHLVFEVTDHIDTMGSSGAAGRNIANAPSMAGGSVLESMNDKVTNVTAPLKRTFRSGMMF